MGKMKQYAEDMSYKLGYEGEIDADILEIANDHFNYNYAKKEHWGTLGQRILVGMRLGDKIRKKRKLSADDQFDLDNPACNRRYELQCQACKHRHIKGDDDFCLLGGDMESIIVCMDWRAKK